MARRARCGPYQVVKSYYSVSEAATALGVDEKTVPHLSHDLDDLGVNARLVVVLDDQRSGV
jgi:hypothetical protein